MDNLHKKNSRDFPNFVDFDYCILALRMLYYARKVEEGMPNLYQRKEGIVYEIHKEHPDFGD